MLRRFCRQATRRRLPFPKEETLTLCNPVCEPTFVSGATLGVSHGVASHIAWHRLIAYAPSSASCIRHRNVCVRWFSRIHRDNALPDTSRMLHASLQRTARTYAGSQNGEEQKTQTKDETREKDVSSQPHHGEMDNILEDMDVSPVTKELRQAQQEMIVRMRRCSYALFGVGAVHIIWGGVMFCALEDPINHAVMTEVCISSLVICGLAYQLRQTLKPVKFFADPEEYRRTQSIFLSRQVTRMIGAFFHRGRGIAFVLSLTLGAHSLACIRFLL